MIKQCEWCGKPFEAVNPRYKICSDECRKLYAKRRAHEWLINNYEDIKKRRKEHYDKTYKPRKNARGKTCEICGELLENACQTFCIKCVIEKCRNAETRAEKKRFKVLLYNRGLTLEDI